EEKAEEATDRGDLNACPCLGAGFAQSLHEPQRDPLEAVVIGLGEQLERREAGGSGDWAAGKRASLIGRAGRSKALHQLTRPGDSRERKTPDQHIAGQREVLGTPVARVCAST